MTLRILLATTALAAAPALAQTAPQGTAAPSTSTGQVGGATGATAGATVSQGAAVYDTQGGSVGTVESVNGDMVVLATQKSKVQLPMSSFASGAKGPVIGMTAAQLDQAAAQASPAGSGTQGGATGAGAAPGASAKANVTQGAAVSDTQGGAVGTVSEVDAQFATVTLTTGGKVRLPISAFGAGANGGLRVAMSAAQLSAAAGASGGGSAASGSGGASSSPGASTSATTTASTKAKGRKGH
jgi:hypothetical protein